MSLLSCYHYKVQYRLHNAHRSHVIGENILFGKNKRKQFKTLFLPHLDAAYNLACYLCGNAYDAEDIVQEAYLRAYRAFGEYRNDNSRAWILTITRNTCHSWMRKYYVNTNVPFDDVSYNTESTTLFSSIEAQTPHQIVESNSHQQQIRQAINALPIEFREVTVLRELEELSYQEIGLVLGIPKGTVMSRLARARKRLRKILTDTKIQGEAERP